MNRLLPGAAQGNRVKDAKQGKHFFFEKKKQKTFFDLVPRGFTGTDQRNQKFFCFFFYKKRRLLAFLRPSRFFTRLACGVAALMLATGMAYAKAPAPSNILRVCAAPHNLPFSNRKRAGFENKIVALIAKSLGDTVRYTWWTQRNALMPATVGSKPCDVWLGVAQGVGALTTTHPYYRSTYVFVTRTSRKLDITSFNDPALRHLKIGVQLLGYAANDTPPVHALARRGITANVRGFALLGTYRHPNPPDAIMQAVEKGSIDVAVVWGPIAGYFAGQRPGTLTVAPVRPSMDGTWPMIFGISMGVRKGNARLQHILNHELAQNRAAIDAILTAYHVPLLPGPGNA